MTLATVEHVHEYISDEHYAVKDDYWFLAAWCFSEQKCKVHEGRDCRYKYEHDPVHVVNLTIKLRGWL